MDEASRIVADLQHKLYELDYKVVQYRHEMCSEFEKYAEHVLCNVTQDVSTKVTKAIAASLMKYPALHPDLQAASNHHKDGHDGHAKSSQHQNQDEPPRSPHAREREFTGLFTPSYLPLLDSTDRHEQRSGRDMIIQAPPLEPKQPPEPNAPATKTTILDPATPTTPTVVLERPPPLRKNTDTSVISNSSDSDSNLRKSALRRSSSSASHSNLLSPRKVRFALEGGEYPTDSSPKPPTIAEEPPKREAIILGFYENDSDDEAGSEQVENIEEPPPKRISSSQALRALSRGPLEDDGTKWTVVAAPPDGSAPVPIKEGKSGTAYIDADDDVEETLEIGGTKGKSHSKHVESSTQANADEPQKKPEQIYLPTNPTPTSSEPVKMNGTSKPQAVSGSIPTPGGLKKSKSTFSIGESDSESDSEAEPNTRAEDDDEEEEEEDMFEFEEGTEIPRPKQNSYKKPESDISTFSPSDLTSPRMASSYRPDVITPSILRSGFRTGSLGNHAAGISSLYGGRHVSNKGSHGGQPVGTPSGIDYAYKGKLAKAHPHPFNQPIATQKAQREAEQLGDLQSWVGSLDGRSGVDDRQGDSGFRSSLGLGAGMGAGSFREGGQPRSLSERLMMDEEMERMERARMEEARMRG